MDLCGANKMLAGGKRKPFDGFLGDLDLRNGSAAIDLAANALYLRPFAHTVWPKREGKWVGVEWESDGQSDKYRAEYERPR
jgi:hypothetical protein